jgi:hypothetical protein
VTAKSGYPGDEEPTRPDATRGVYALVIARLFDQLAPIDQKRLSKLVECWFTAGTDERILLEELAVRLARRRLP